MIKWVWYNWKRVFSYQPEVNSDRELVWFKGWQLMVYRGNDWTNAHTLQYFNWEWNDVPTSWELDYYDSFEATYIGTQEDWLVATAKFYNWDTVLATVQVKDWETPEYTGDTPTKEADEENTYTFDGWNPALWPISKDTDFVAKFKATPKN